MNVLHISRTMGQGGAEKIVFQLCRDNNSVTQFVASCGGIYVSQLEKIGVKHFQIGDIDNKNPLLILRTLITLNAIIKKNSIDIMHTHHRMAAFYARLIQILNPKLMHVYTAHNIFYGRAMLMRFALKKAQIVAVGDGVRDNLSAEYGISDEKIHVIYNAIDTKHAGQETNPIVQKLNDKGQFVIGSIGRLSEQKGMDIFVKAVAKAHTAIPKLRAVIIGDGELKHKIEDCIRDLNMQDIVFMLGYQANVLEIIGQLQFVVLASRWEGLPLTPIETFSQGKTIIATDISGNNEVISHNRTGLLFRLDDAGELADKIELLYKNMELKERLECNAKNEFAGKYDYGKFIERYAGIYNFDNNLTKGTPHFPN